MRRVRCSPQQQPSINLQINVNSKPLSDTDFEIELMVEGKADAAGTVLFTFELVYAGIFRLHNVPADAVQAVMMIECPRLLFPYAREIVSAAVRNGGFPPLMIDPVDFVSLYRQKMQQAQHGAGRELSAAVIPDAASAMNPKPKTVSLVRRVARDDNLSVILPDRLFAERAMNAHARRAPARDARGAAPAARAMRASAGDDCAAAREAEHRLARADQLDIDFRQQFGVEQRAVLGALRIVDPVAHAQIVELVGAARMLAPRQHQCVDDALAPEDRLASRARARH